MLRKGIKAFGSLSWFLVGFQGIEGYQINGLWISKVILHINWHMLINCILVNPFQKRSLGFLLHLVPHPITEPYSWRPPSGILWSFCARNGVSGSEISKYRMDWDSSSPLPGCIRLLLFTWIPAVPPAQSPNPFPACVLTQLSLALPQKDYWTPEMSIDRLWLHILACGDLHLAPLPPFLLGHHLPLGLQSDRGTEAILCTQDPALIRKLTFCSITVRCKGQVSLAIATWQNDNDDDHHRNSQHL